MEDEEDLEELELRLIQSIKTSGLKKPRETLVIDQLLDMRKLRKRKSSRMSSRVSELEEQVRSLVSRQCELTKELEQWSSRTQEAVDKESRRVEAEYRAKFSEYTSRRDGSVRQFVVTLKEKYNSQISVLERKLQQIGEACRDDEALRLAEEQRREIEQLKENQRLQLEQQQRYKDAILGLTEREKMLESALHRESDKTRRLEDENRQLLSRIEALDTDLKENMNKLTAQKSKYKSMFAKAEEDFGRERFSLEGQLKAAAGELESARLQIKELEQRHEAEMNLVDAKIRRAMSAKDEVIHDLAAKLRISDRKVKSAEALIEDLNAGLSEA